jgi:Uncharacterised protein family (UPF0182)
LADAGALLVRAAFGWQHPDTIFSKGLHFFLFTLPAWQLINGWLLTLAFAACVVAVLFVLITTGARSLAKGRITYAPSPWRGLSLTVAFLLLVLAMTVYANRFQLSLEHHIDLRWSHLHRCTRDDSGNAHRVRRTGDWRRDHVRQCSTSITREADRGCDPPCCLQLWCGESCRVVRRQLYRQAE